MVDTPGYLEHTGNADKSQNRYGASRKQLEVLVDEFTHTLSESGSQYHPLIKQAAALGKRLKEGRFHLAVLGQFKRGKSSLLNALLGADILPTGVIPLTAIPTFIEYGQTQEVQVHYLNGRCKVISPRELPSYVAEELNPNNEKGIKHARVYYPSSLLSSGVVLIDTPGVGSTHRHNTDTTLAFLPECDAALFVISADPPLTEAETDFLDKVRARVPHLLFLLNKADYLTKEELDQTLQFIGTVLCEKMDLHAKPLIFPVSARLGLKARTSNLSSLWAKSGCEQLESYLTTFLVEDKSRALNLAVASKLSVLASQASTLLDIENKTSTMPLQKIEEHLQIINNRIQTIKDDQVHLEDLALGDLKRVQHSIRQHMDELTIRAGKQLLDAADRSIEAHSNERHLPAETEVHKTLAPIIKRYFTAEWPKMREWLTKEIRSVLAPYHEQTKEHIDAVTKTTSDLFEIPFVSFAGEESVEIQCDPYWVTGKISSSVMIPDQFIDRFLPASWRRRRMKKRISEEIELLVRKNVEGIRWALLQTADENFRHFMSRLRDELDEICCLTQGSIRRMQQIRTRERGSVARIQRSLRMAQEEMARIDSKAMQLVKAESGIYATKHTGLKPGVVEKSGDDNQKT